MERTEALERLAGLAQRHDRADLLDDVELLLDQFDRAADRCCHTPTILPLRRLILHVLRMTTPIERAGDRDDKRDHATQGERHAADQRSRPYPSAPHWFRPRHRDGP